MRYQVRLHPTIDVIVSSIGEVFVPANAHHKAHWTFGCDNGKGYMTVKIDGKNYRVHRLVAGCFLPNPKDLPQVDHISRDKKANFVENLRWATNSDNNRNTSKNDRVNARGGTHRYEDYRLFCRERNARYRKTHKRVLFSDGKQRHIPNSEALELLKLPVKDRHYGK